MAHEKDCDENIESLKALLKLNNVRFRIRTAKCLPGSNSGDNYMSVVKRIKITGQYARQEKTLSLIIKRQILSLSRRELYRCDDAFSNEISAYNKVVPILEKHISPKPFFPKCYFAGTDKHGEIVVLEDLKETGYSMHDRMSGLDLEHCQLVMHELAKLHAASIGAQRSTYNIFHEKKNCLRDIVYCDEAEIFYKGVLQTGVKEALVSLNTSNTDGSLSEPIRLIELIQTQLFENIKADITSMTAKNAVVCHGDLWINNIMFKYDAITGRPCALKFFDLQAMRYASPIYDILHFVYTSTKREVRAVHLKAILEVYCLRMAWHIDHQRYPDIKVNVNEIRNSFSLQNITNEFYEKILYGFAIGSWILPAVTFDPLNIPNLDLLSEITTSGSELKCTKKLTPEYHSRIKDLTLEFYHNGFLKIPNVETS